MERTCIEKSSVKTKAHPNAKINLACAVPGMIVIKNNVLRWWRGTGGGDVRLTRSFPSDVTGVQAGYRAKHRNN